MELPLDICQGHIDVTHGHVGAGMAEQFHDRSKAHAGTEDFCSVGMPELVGNDIRGKSNRVACHMQVIAEPCK